MDPGKRRALINWWNAVSEKKVKSFADLRDGTVIANVLLTCGDNLIPKETDLRSPQKCLSAVKCYIESFYHQSMDDGTLINFGLLGDKNVKQEVLELEVGKLLLALLGCVIQDRGRENFITPALTIDEESQSEMRMIIMSTICSSEIESKLQPGFHQVLKQKQEPSSHLDAALFFKLVAEGGTSAVGTPGPHTPAAAHGGSFVTMYTNSPQANTSGLNIRDISSPMRLMSLSSPVTPLEALMSSPRLTQKAALRQKDYEYRRLEAALRNEQHLRSEVELDLKERSETIEEKEMRIRELERQLAGVRQVRDKLDELEELQTANEALRKDVTRLQNRLKNSQDLREHNAVLQRENSEYLADLQKARDEIKVLDSIQRASETYRVKCHKLQLEISELELALQHRQEENGTLQQSLDELKKMHELATDQCRVLKTEKEELEELLGTRNAEMASSGMCSLGESMNVVTEKKLAELQAQYETIRTSWIDPHQHTTIIKELAMEKETKKTYEERYFEVKKKLIGTEDHLQKLNVNLLQSKSVVIELETNLQEAGQVRQSLESQVTDLRLGEEALKQSEAMLRAEKEQREASVEALEKELSRYQTELELTRKDLEVVNETSEARRTTVQQMDQERLQKQQTEQKLTKEIETLSKELEVWKAKGEALLESQEEAVKLKMEKEDVKKRFSEKVENLEEEIGKKDNMLQAEKKLSEEKMSDMENRLQNEKSECEKRLHDKERLQEEFEQFKICVDEKEKTLEEKLETAVKDKRTVDLELHRLNLELSSSTDSYSTKIGKMDAKFKDEAEVLKKEIQSLKNSKEDCLSDQERLIEEIGKLNQTIQKQKDEIQKLNQLVESLKLANSELVDSHEESKVTVVQDGYKLKTLKEELENEQTHSAALKKEKTEQINFLQRQLDETVTKYTTEKSQLSQQIEKMEVELEERKKEFTDMKCHMESELSNLNCDYEKKLNDMKNNCEKDAENSKEKLQELMSSNEKEVDALKSTIRDLEQKLKNSENVRIELEFEKSKLVEEHEAHVSILNSSYAEQLTALKSDLTGSEQKALQTREASAYEIVRLTASLGEKSAALDQLKEEHKAFEQKHDKATCEMRVKIGHTESELKISSESNLTLKQEKETLEFQLNELRNACTDLKSELSRSTVSASNVKCDFESKLLHESGLRADLESKLSVLTKEQKVVKDKLEQTFKEKISLEQTLEKLQTSYESEMGELKEKLDETEHYWKSQCEDLAEEYEKGTEEQKENMSQQLEELKDMYEAQMEKLSDEKDLCIASQAQSYQERIKGLEKVVAEKKEDLGKQAEEMAALEERYNKKVEDHRNELTTQTELQNGTTVEMEALKSQICQQKEDNKKEVEMLIGQYETQLEELSVQLKTEHDENQKKLEEQYKAQVEKLQNEVDEQRVNYQQMMCNMEEKLGGEAVVLRERLSQMKCQYEALIETKEKETNTKVSDFESKVSEYEVKVSDFESKVSEYEVKVSDFENKLRVSEEEKTGLRQELVVVNQEKTGLHQEMGTVNQEISRLQTDKTELINKNLELENVITNLRNTQQELEEKIAQMQELISSVQAELGAMKESARRAFDEVSKEKGEVEELKRQLEYSRDRNDTLTAELSSQQQQLAAVEEEKRVLEVDVKRQASGHKLELEEVAMKQDKHGLEVEELERQLQASQKCYEAVQKSQTELEVQMKKGSEERANLETRNRELEQRIYNYLEREKKMVADNQHQIDKAAELNGTLRRQLDEKCRELHSLNEQYNNKVEAMTEDFGRMKKKFEKDLQALLEDKTTLEIDAAQMKKVEERLKVSEGETKRLQDVNNQYNIHYNKKKEIISGLEAKLKAKEQEIDELRRTEQKLLEEITPAREKLNIERMKNSKLTSKVRSLEAQGNLADRKLREYKQALEKGNAVFLGDSTEFQNMLRERESSSDASFMAKHPSSMPLNDSVFEFEKHDVEKHQAFYDDSRSMSETLTPNSRNTRSKKRMSKSVSSSTVISSENDPDTVSIGSATSLAYRLRSRESAVSLNRSYTSFNSCKSNASVPRGTGGIFHCEDEPMEFEWGRLGELQRRNTLCPAHLKTSYPVETQTYKPARFREDSLRESTMGNQTVLEQVTGSGRKRKLGRESDSGGSDSDGKNKQAKTGRVYHKPGPPTPANQRRNSGKGSRSPGSRSSKGSVSPYSLRSKRTPRRTPKHTPKRTGVVDNCENAGSAKKAGWRDGVAFQIGFSPQSTSSHKHLRRQHAFVQKQPQSSSQVSNLVNFFEKQSTPTSAPPPLPPRPTPSPSFRSFTSAVKEEAESKCNFSSRRNIDQNNVFERYRTPDILQQSASKTYICNPRVEINKPDSETREPGSPEKMAEERNASVKRHLSFERYPRAEHVYHEIDNIYDEIKDIGPRTSLSKGPPRFSQSESVLGKPLAPVLQSTPVFSSMADITTGTSQQRNRFVHYLGDSPNCLRQSTSLGHKNNVRRKKVSSPKNSPARRPFVSSSTSRFRGTPIKLKISEGLTPKEFKSCSTLFNSPKFKKKKKNRPLTPRRIHTGDTYTGDGLNNVNEDDMFNAFETVQRGNPTKEPDSAGMTPGRLSRWFSKIITPNKGTKVVPFDNYF